MQAENWRPILRTSCSPRTTTAIWPCIRAAKDALMSGTGIIKVQYDDTPERVVERYDGLQEPQLQALLADPMLEVTEIERSETDGIAVTAARIVKQGRVVVECCSP